MNKEDELQQARDLVRGILEDIINKMPKGCAVTTKQLEDYVYKKKEVEENKYIQQNLNYVNAFIGSFIKNNKLNFRRRKAIAFL